MGLMGSLGHAAGAGEAAANLKFGEAIKELIASATSLIGSISDIKAMFQSLRGTIMETVGAYRPFAVTQFNRAVKDLQAVFGQMFLPIMRDATATVRQFANYVYSLPESFRGAITSLVRLGVLSGAIVAIGGALSTLSAVLAPIQGIVAWLKYLTDSFRSTVGGATALFQAWQTMERGIAGLLGVLQAAWDATADFRAVLREAFDELGSALGDLFQELRPVLAVILGAIGIFVKGELNRVISTITLLVRAITSIATAIGRVLRPLADFLRGLGIDLPEVFRKKRDAFGLGTGGATVSDPMSVYNRLTEELMRNSRDDKPQTPDEMTASSTEKMANVMDLLNKPLQDFLSKGSKIFDRIDKLLDDPVGLIKDMAKGAIWARE